MPESAPAAQLMPTWVKVFIAVAVVAAGAFLILHLTGMAPTGH